jgi:hypothetical protein
MVDKGITEREFQVEDLVYVKSRPCKQLNTALNKNIKLNPCFYGPYNTIQRVGPWLISCNYQKGLPFTLYFIHNCLNEGGK